MSQNLVALAARILLALMFILGGVSKFAGLAGTAGYIASKGLPLPMVLAVLTAALELGAGVALVIGWRVRVAALALALFTLLASLIFHAYWAAPAEQQMVQQLLFMKNLAVAGGLMLLVGFGAGGTSIVLSATVANTWFFERRGLVTGILGGAASAGQLVFILLLAEVVDVWGWRQAVGLMALLVTVVVLPLAVIFLRSRPSDVGLTAYGSRPGQLPLASDERLVPMKEALRTGDFWLIALSFSVCGFTTIGLVGTHFIPHATEHGFTEKQAAGILSIIGAFNVIGTIASGWLTDRYSPRKLLAVYYALRGLSLVVLPAISTVPLMSAFAVVFGLDYIATVPPTVMLTANRFGRRSVGTIYGWVTFSHMVGGAIAAALAGYIHDAAGDYGYAMYAGGILALLAAAVAFNIGARPPKTTGLPAPAAGY